MKLYWIRINLLKLLTNDKNEMCSKTHSLNFVKNTKFFEFLLLRNLFFNQRSYFAQNILVICTSVCIFYSFIPRPNSEHDVGLVISCSIEKIYQSKDSIDSKSVAFYIASNSMVMQAKYIIGPRSMSKSSMQLEDIFWNSIPDTRAQATGSSSCGSYYCCRLSQVEQ